METKITLHINTSDPVQLYTEEAFDPENKKEDFEIPKEETHETAHKGILKALEEHIKEFFLSLEEEVVLNDYFYEIEYEGGEEVADYVALKVDWLEQGEGERVAKMTIHDQPRNKPTNQEEKYDEEKE